MTIYHTNKLVHIICFLSNLFRAIGYIPGVVFYPILTWLFIVITVGYWAVTAVYPNKNIIVLLLYCYI